MDVSVEPERAELDAHATVWTLPSTFARAKYDPEEPFEIIFG